MQHRSEEAADVEVSIGQRGVHDGARRREFLRGQRGAAAVKRGAGEDQHWSSKRRAFKSFHFAPLCRFKACAKTLRKKRAKLK